MSLRTILKEYAQPVEGGPGEHTAFPVEELRDRLEALRRENGRYFMLCAAMVAVLFLAALWVILTHLESGQVAGLTIVGAGVSAGIAMILMLRLLREKVLTDSLLALSVAMDPDVLKSIVDVLLRRL